MVLWSRFVFLQMGHSSPSVMVKQVLQQQKKERALMKRTGFVPHVDEDNNGKPVYTDIDAETINDESGLNGSTSPSSEGGTGGKE